MYITDKTTHVKIRNEREKREQSLESKHKARNNKMEKNKPSHGIRVLMPKYLNLMSHRLIALQTVIVATAFGATNRASDTAIAPAISLWFFVPHVSVNSNSKHVEEIIDVKYVRENQVHFI